MQSILQWIKTDYTRFCFVVIISVLFFSLIKMSSDAGMSGDEHFHFKQAEDVVNFYITFGKDTTALSDVRTPGSNFYLYGQLPDNISYLIASFFKIEDIVSVRHFVNSIFGWLGILFVGLLAFRLSGNWMAAIIASLLLFFSPRYLGHSFNNLKDVPFAAMMMMGVYYITYFFQTFPKIPKKVFVMLALSIGFALAIRVGGLLLVAYFGLFGIIFFLKKWIETRAQIKKNKKIAVEQKKELSATFTKLLKYGLIITLAGYAVGVLLWPYALVSPIGHVKETFLAMSSFGSSLRQNFEGMMQWSDALPWYYTPKYILITIPIAVIIGFLIYPFIGGCKKENRFNTFIVYFACIFPIFWIVYSNANVYGGWRHALFAYPPMVVAAGLGFNAIIELCKNKYLKIAATALPFLLLTTPIIHIVKNHPYEYVYFNEFVGGMKGAYGNYETDYYYHSTREATEWVIANAEEKDNDEKIIVASWHPASVGYFLRNDTNKFESIFIRWHERGDSDWDYAIFVVTGISPDLQKSNYFPPENTVHTIDVDGKPICIILKRTDWSDLKGFQFKEERIYDSAEIYLNKSLINDPTNQSITANLAEIYFNTNQLDKAKEVLDRFLQIEPNNELANTYLMHYYIYTDDAQNALVLCEKLKTINFKSPQAYLTAYQIYLSGNNLRAAEKELNALIDVDRLDNQAADLLIKIYMQQGLDQRGAVKKLYKTLAEIYKKRGNKELYEEYIQVYYIIKFNVNSQSK